MPHNSLTQDTLTHAPLTDLILEVFRLNGALLAAGDALSAPCGLTSARWQVLGAIDAGPATVADIARTMGLTRQSVQRTVDILKADGIVVLDDNPAHKRARLVRLPERGRAALDHVTVLQRRWAAALADGFDDAALTTALSVIRALRERLDQTPVEEAR